MTCMRNEETIIPPYYIIEPTNFCNFSCPICPNRKYAREDKGYMSWELFIKIIEDIREYANVIQLYWMGEPLLHKQIFQMIDYCKENTHAKVMMSTNGSLLSRSVTDRLLATKIDEIIISMDAYDSQEIYSKIRTGGNLSKLNENVEYLLKVNRDANIVLQFIDMYINKGEKESFVNKWSRYNCIVNVQCIYSWANQFPSLNLTSDNTSPVKYKKRVPCEDLWKKVSIRWDGTLALCCFDWSSKVEIGNINSTPLLELWNSSQISKLREYHLAGNYVKIPICAECDSWAEPEEYADLFHLT